jgi:predicted membrane chloride channel (bestrophin family)
MTSDDRLVEIRDLLGQLLEQARATARKQDELMETYRAAIASHRKLQLFGVVVIVVLLGLLGTMMFR